MREEKKDSKNKKLVYEVPRLVQLSGKSGKGQPICADGSGDAACFSTGSVASVCEFGQGGGEPPPP